MLIQLTTIKDALGYPASNEDYDTLLTRLINKAGALFDRYTRRTLEMPAADVTEYYTGCGQILQLQRYPIVAITSIKESWDYDFDNATALTENTDYRILAGGEKGIIVRLYSHWPDVPDSVQITYTGGFVPAGEDPGEGETAIPADLAGAAVDQVVFWFKNRDRIGLTSVSHAGGSVEVTEKFALLAGVKEILDMYKRL